MNILTVVPWDQEYGGVASVVGNLAKQMKRKGHNVYFLFPGNSNALKTKVTKWNFPGYELKLRGPFIATHPLKSRIAFLGFLLPTLLQLVILLLRHRIEIVNVHYPTDEDIYFAVLRKVLPIKLVVSAHGADLLPDGKPRENYSNAVRILMRSADLLVTPSRSMLAEVLVLFPHLQRKGIWIHSAVDLNELEPDGNISDPDIGYILCVAAHVYKKGIDILINAFKELNEIHQKLKLYLVGDGPLREELERLTQVLGITEQVKFLGSRNRQEIKGLMRGCTLFVLPSRHEPFGIVITEALAFQKPVVATAVGGITEIIENYVTGILVEPESPSALVKGMRAVLEDAKLGDRLARNGYELIKERFQWEIAAARYESAFSRLLSPQKGGGASTGQAP
jgi:glycosyltransferase involved in cell wall biosynthesis